MTILKLTQYILQYCEQSPDMNVTEETLDELLDDDTLSEYMNNVSHCIYAGLVRFAESGVLPYQEEDFTSDSNIVNLINKAHRIVEVYGYNSNGNLVNVKYHVTGKKVRLLNRQSDCTYTIVYAPMINDLSTYLTKDITTIWDIDLEELGVPDELAILIKYLAYSELKIEDNADMANQNKNYFETYLSEAVTKQIHNNQTQVKYYENSDIYGSEESE